MNTHIAPAVRTFMVCGVLVLGVASALQAQDPPVYKVDPFWPKPLPNKWSMQQVVDSYVETSTPARSKTASGFRSSS